MTDRPDRPDRGDRTRANRIRSIVRDIRALGMGAPLRAGYEASKRTGGHSLVFRRWVPTTGGVQTGQSPLLVPVVSEPVRERTVAEANRIVDGTIEIFGRRLDLGDPPDWQAVIHTDGSWPVVDWWQIDLRSDARPGDVKWAWELGRHRHLVILARAAHLEPAEGRFQEVLERHLESWLESNPLETGIHWYSNLEIALRAIAWLQILALVGDRLNPDVREAMWCHLHHSGRHLIADLPYTVSTMRNNHLLGDALGLIALGKAFGGKNGRRWESIGNRIFSGQLRRHMHADGSMVEDSLSYHRFVLEMLSMRVLLGGVPTDVHDAMERAAQFLARLGALEGPVPQYGDWDEGRVFAVSKDPTRLDGSILLALALAGDGAPEEWRIAHDEVAWFVDEGEAVAPEKPTVDGSDIGGGIGRAEAGPYTIWLKGGSGPSHGHADLSSVAIAHDGKWVVGDPGTGTYNGPIEERNYFRTSVAHNVLRISGEDQLVPHRAFRWSHQATGIVGDPVHVGSIVVMWSVHDAYARLSPQRRVVRIVVVDPSGVEVSDHVEGTPLSAELAMPIHPDATWNDSELVVTVAGERFGLMLPRDDVAVAHGSEEPYVGWWSDTYGTAEPTTALQMRVDTAEPVRWGIAESDGESSPISMTVLFEASAVRLRVEVDGRTFLRSI